MRIDVFEDAVAAANHGAAVIAAEARAAVGARGRFVMAVSGGHTPWMMFKALATHDIPWHAVYVAQVDERVAPLGDPDRNLTQLREYLLGHVPLPADHVLPMPVESADLQQAALDYAQTLAGVAGSPIVLDLIHLGLGADGHTASLVPGDPVLHVSDADVAATGNYQGRRRMTLTYPLLNRARRILWLVSGSDKVSALSRLRDADPSIPAGRVNQAQALALADRAAAADL